MELQECISTRRTIRDFSELAVPSAIIEKALLAGMKAPSQELPLAEGLGRCSTWMSTRCEAVTW